MPTRAEYDARNDAILDELSRLNSAIETSRAEGERQAKIESAKRFLEMGFPLEQVAQGTGLSREEIKELK